MAMISGARSGLSISTYSIPFSSQTMHTAHVYVDRAEPMISGFGMAFLPRCRQASSPNDRNWSDLRRQPIPGEFGKSRTTEMVESRMGAVAWGLWPTLRFPSPLIKPGVPISGTRLSDWLHRKAHGDKLTARGFGTVSNSPSPLDTAISGGACH